VVVVGEGQRWKKKREDDLMEERGWGW